jgi:hypothetical protein
MKPQYEIFILTRVIKTYTGQYQTHNLKNTIWPNTYLNGAITIKVEGDKKARVDVTLNL